MKITPEQYDKIKSVWPVQRGSVEIDYFSRFQALQYVCENSCQCRASPKNLATGTAFAIIFVTGFGRAGSIKFKTNCGRKPLISKELRNSHWTSPPSKYTPAEPACPSRVSVRMPPSPGTSRGGRTTKSHIIVTDDPEGQRLMGPIPKHLCSGKPLLMDKAYEGGHYRNRARRYENAMLRF